MQRLEHLRKRSGLNKGAFSDEVGVKQIFSRYADPKPGSRERKVKAPSTDTLLRISERFNVSIDWLLFGREPEAIEVVHIDCPVSRAHNPLDRRPPDPRVITTLGMAWSVLESATSTAEALKLNVHEFYEKVFTPPAQGSAGGGQGPAAGGAAVSGAKPKKKARSK